MTVHGKSSPLWDEWDAKVHDRSEIPETLGASTDEDLVKLLAGASPRDRKYERDVIATEVLNRMHRRQRELPERATGVLRSAEDAHDAAAKGQHAIHTAEELLKANGNKALGTEVSASAYSSLDRTKDALDAARANSAGVESAVSRSRHASGPATDAAAAGKRGVAAGQDAADSLEKMGRGKEGLAAREAASEIREKADDAADAIEKS